MLYLLSPWLQAAAAVSAVQLELMFRVPAGQEQTGLWDTTLHRLPAMGHTEEEEEGGEVEEGEEEGNEDVVEEEQGFLQPLSKHDWVSWQSESLEQGLIRLREAEAVSPSVCACTRLGWACSSASTRTSTMVLSGAWVPVLGHVTSCPGLSILAIGA